MLKPPGGGSSDLFGPMGSESAPRKVKTNANQSQLTQGFFAGTDDQVDHHHQAGMKNGGGGAGSGSSSVSDGSSAPQTPRSKGLPGNDSHNRLFGPPDAPPPMTPNSKTYRSSISLSSDKSTESLKNGAAGSRRSSESLSTNGYNHNDVVGT